MIGLPLISWLFSCREECFIHIATVHISPVPRNSKGSGNARENFRHVGVIELKRAFHLLVDG